MMRASSRAGHASFHVVRSTAPRLRPRGAVISAGQVARRLSTRATWLESSAAVDVDVPLALAWDLWQDRESIPNFMPWITSVTVDPSDEALSMWKLETQAFERMWTLTWLARNRAPIKYQRISWVSVEGSTQGTGGLEVSNKGEVRFAQRGASRCNVRLGIQFEVPDALAPFAGALTPFVDRVLNEDMKRFATYAVSKLQAEKVSTGAQ